MYLLNLFILQTVIVITKFVQLVFGIILENQLSRGKTQKYCVKMW